MSFHTKKNPTAGLATFSFNDDTDTGIDSDAANQLDFMTGGTVRAKVNASGLSVDTINEYTANAGVTLDSVLLKDGGATMTGNLTLTGALVPAGSYRPVQYYKASIDSSIAGTTTAGGVFRFVNPFSSTSSAALVLGVYVHLGTAASSATATIDIGTATASSVSGDNLIDGIALTGAGVFNNVASSGTNGTAIGRTLASNGWITGTVATGNISNVVGNVYFSFIPQ